MYPLGVKSFAAWMLLLSASSALGDDAAWTVVGGAGNFSHSKHVRMVSERVEIKLEDKRSHFRAEFMFRNEGPATSVTMAFPEENHGSPRKQVIDHFVSTVDGKSVPVHRKVLPRSAGIHYAEYVAAWLKEVPFARGQTRKVTVDYWAYNGDIGDYVQNVYVLKTGASWKGKIDKAILVVDWSGLRGRSEPAFTWDGGDERRDKDVDATMVGRMKAEIVLLNVEPVYDFHILWTNAFWNFEVNGKTVEGTGYLERDQIVAGDGSDPMIKVQHLGQLLPHQDAGSRSYEEELTPMLPVEVANRFVGVDGKNRLTIDGVPARLRRPIKDGMVYVRDLVQALHGTFRYESERDRVSIRVK
jgi:hypothetical protein